MTSTTARTTLQDTEARGPAPAARCLSWIRDRREPLLALGAYLVLALVVTWPWVTDPGDVLYGLVGGDLTSSVASYQQLAEDLQPPFLPGSMNDLNAPEGLPTNWTLSLAGTGSSATLFGLSVPFGSVAAHGIVAVLGFVLSAFAMFLLVRRITSRPGPGFVAGLAFGFWPFSYETGWTWPHYIHSWVFVLLVWRMLVATERPTARNGVLAGAATVLAMTWIQYYLLIGGVLFATLVLVALARGAQAGNLRGQVRTQAVAAAIVGAVALVIVVLAAATEYRGVPVRPASDAVSNSARPLMYVVPGPLHPLFGDSAGDWIRKKYTLPEFGGTATAGYAAIYLGVPSILMALAGAGVILARVRRLRLRALADGVAAAGITAAVVVLVGLLFSAPPEVRVLGVTVPMPYSVVNEVTTTFRVAHRFAVLVMLGACVLAGIALSQLVQRLPRRAGSPRCSCSQPLSAWTSRLLRRSARAYSTPGSTTCSSVSRPGSWPRSAHWSRGVQNLGSLFQDVHEHPTFAGWDNGSESGSRKTELTYLPAPRTVPDLAAYGVEYVIIHRVDGGPDWLPAPGDPVPGLRLIGQDSSGALYRVVARPSITTSYAVSGFNGPEGEPPRFVRWLAENGGRIELRSDCDPCTGIVSFSSGTFATPRVLTIRDPEGQVLHEQTIEGQGVPVRFPVRFSRRTELVFSTDPRPIRSTPWSAARTRGASASTSVSRCASFRTLSEGGDPVDLAVQDLVPARQARGGGHDPLQLIERAGRLEQARHGPDQRLPIPGRNLRDEFPEMLVRGQVVHHRGQPAVSASPTAMPQPSSTLGATNRVAERSSDHFSSSLTNPGTARFPRPSPCARRVSSARSGPSPIIVTRASGMALRERPRQGQHVPDALLSVNRPVNRTSAPLAASAAAADWRGRMRYASLRSTRGPDRRTRARPSSGRCRRTRRARGRFSRVTDSVSAATERRDAGSGGVPCPLTRWYT